ncbi:MAG: carbohydrate kinase [Rhizobiaceae bacterium]
MILVGGENLVDLIQSKDGSGNGGGISFDAAAGGSPYNCAMALGRQDVAVRYATPISTDALGDILATTLKQSGVELAGPRIADPTSLAVVMLNDGQPSYQFYRDNTAERRIDAQALESLMSEQVEAFHVGSLGIIEGADADLWADFFCKANRHGGIRSLDPNVRAMLIHDRDAYLERLWRMLKNVDLLKLSDEDLEWIYPEKSLDEAYAELLGQTSAKLTVLTMGAEGCRAHSVKADMELPASPVANLQDTVGAGDTFMATLLSGLQKRSMLSATDLEEIEPDILSDILQTALQAAALNCERKGCNPPTSQELEQALSA